MTYFDGKKYLSTREAHKLTGYTTDYIGQLCRGGLVVAKQVDRVWYIQEKDLLRYQEGILMGVPREKNTPESSNIPNSQENVVGTNSSEEDTLQPPKASAVVSISGTAAVSQDDELSSRFRRSTKKRGAKTVMLATVVGAIMLALSTGLVGRQAVREWWKGYEHQEAVAIVSRSLHSTHARLEGVQHAMARIDSAVSSVGFIAQVAFDRLGLEPIFSGARDQLAQISQFGTAAENPVDQRDRLYATSTLNTFRRLSRGEGTIVYNTNIRGTQNLDVLGSVTTGDLTSSGPIVGQGSVTSQGPFTSGGQATLNAGLTVTGQTSLDTASVSGQLSALGGISTEGTDIDLGGGVLLNTEIVREIRAGDNIEIEEAEDGRPIISADFSDSNTTYTAGDDLVLSGTTFSLDSSIDVSSISGLGSLTGGGLTATFTGGRLGIDTTSPSSTLSVGGSFGVTGTTTFNGLTYTWPTTQNNGYILSTDGNGELSWIQNSSSASTPGSNDGAVQFNDGGDFGGDADNFFWDDVQNRLGIATTSPASSLAVGGVITANGGNSTRWNEAYGWGDHSIAGYLDNVTAAGLEASGTNLALSSGYVIPTTASTTAWEAFRDVPSTRITAGPGLSWTGNTLAALLGDSIDTTEIEDGTILGVDLSTTSPATDGQILSYDDATGGFTWVANPGAATSTPGSTDGAVQFNDAGGFGGDVDNFFWDSSTNRLGIGTSSPASALDVNGTITA
ncbi:MAG: helix-turn-helix domain-containing protein, partial [Candidatus Paceibacterota bacterium]